MEIYLCNTFSNNTKNGMMNIEPQKGRPFGRDAGVVVGMTPPVSGVGTAAERPA